MSTRQPGSARAILIILTIYEDAAGESFTPLNAAELIAERVTAPIRAVYDTYTGRGVVGGSFVTFADIGEAIAELALDLADGDPAGKLSGGAPPQTLMGWRKREAARIDPSLLRRVPSCSTTTRWPGNAIDRRFCWWQGSSCSRAE